MTVYVDNMRRAAQLTGRPAKWSHLMADTPEELAAIATMLGLRPSWLQHAGTHREHYDVTETVRTAAIRLGALPITYPRETGELLARKRVAQGGAGRMTKNRQNDDHVNDYYDDDFTYCQGCTEASGDYVLVVDCPVREGRKS